MCDKVVMFTTKLYCLSGIPGGAPGEWDWMELVREKDGFVATFSTPEQKERVEKAVAYACQRPFALTAFDLWCDALQEEWRPRWYTVTDFGMENMTFVQRAEMLAQLSVDITMLERLPKWSRGQARRFRALWETKGRLLQAARR